MGTENGLRIPVNRSEKIRVSYVAIASVGENPRSRHAATTPEMKKFEEKVSREGLKGRFEGQVRAMSRREDIKRRFDGKV